MSYLNIKRQKAINSVSTHEQGTGRKAEAREELAMLALSTFLGDSFYETSQDTLARMYRLVQEVPQEYVTQLARVARQEFNMRATPAALIGFHLLAFGQPKDGRVIRDVYFRGDELGDTLSVVTRYSDNSKVIPSAARFSRAVIQSQLNERKALRYMRSNREWSLDKLIRISHARSEATERQRALYNFVLRWHSEGSLRKAWDATPESDREHLQTIGKAVNGEDAGEVSWERSRSAGSDWKSLVSDMGYMALLRNLRNFMEDTSLADDNEFWDYVTTRIADPEEVARSKQLPFRFLSAYRALPRGHRKYGKVSQAVSDALDASVGNLPRLNGRTLIVADVSGSMEWGRVSGQSDITYADVATLFAAAMFQSQDADVVAFASTARKMELSKNDSILTNQSKIAKANVGGGTSLHAAFRAITDVNEYDNIVIFSDMQVHDDAKTPLKGYKGNVFSVNLAAYEAQLQTVGSRFYAIGGWSDATVKLMGALSSGSLVKYIQDYE